MLAFLLVVVVSACAAFAQSPRFTSDVYPMLKKADCMGCHQGNGVASTTRLRFPDEGASADEIEAFGDSLRTFVDKADPSKSLLLMKPTNRIAHAGGKRIESGGLEEALLLGWVKHLATSQPLARKATTGRARGEETVLRRLTHSQYDNAVRDLLGDNTFPSRQFPPEDFIDGFKNQYEGQSVSPLLAEAYGTAAEALAAAYEPKMKGAGFVTTFGLRAFRRPLTAEEKRRYTGLYGKGGAKLVVEAMLQSPAFLFRLESTNNPAHKAYARASRLSYLLWDTMPDDDIFAAAARGDLDTREGFEKVARRMLASPKARAGLDEFIAQWMRFDRVVSMVKDRRSFPLFTREIAQAMTEETRRFIADLVWSDRDFMEFYTANWAFLNGEVAPLYGMKAPSDEFTKVEFPAHTQRAGILGQATFLALTSKPADTSPTARGLFVREQFLCQQVPQPPPGVSTNLPVQSPDKPMTNRELLSVHLSSPSCASCHNLIDPIGFGLEKFDAVGAYREKMRVTIPSFDRRQEPKRVELPIDASGFVAGIKESNFSTPKELGRILAESPVCQECIVKQYFRYAIGRHEKRADDPVLLRVTEEFRASRFQFKELMISLARWTEFPPPGEAHGTTVSKNLP